MAKEIVVYPFNIIPLSNKKERIINTTMRINIKIIILSERIQHPFPKKTLEYILCDSIYVKFYKI